MKAILNWRYYAIFALLAIGALFAARIFGEPSRPVADAAWCLQAVISAAVSAASFLLLARCVNRWQRRGQIPAITDIDPE